MQLPDRASDSGPTKKSTTCPACGETDVTITVCAKCDQLTCEECGTKQPDGKYLCATHELEREEDARDWWDWMYHTQAEASAAKRIEEDDPANQKTARLAAAREIIRMAQRAIDLEENA